MTNIKNGDVDDYVFILAIRVYLWYMQLFMYIFIGQQLSQHGEKLQIALYSCPWYNMSTDLAKDVKFIIMRNNHFCHLTAGGIFIMNFEAFKDINRLMFTYFSVLKLSLESK